MKLKTRFGVFLGAFLLAAGGMVAVSAPASANPATNCIGRVCIFPQASMTTPSYYWTGQGLVVGQCYKIEGVHNNTAKGVASWIGSGYVVSWFISSFCNATSLVTATSYNSGRSWANCTNTDLWGGTYGPPATWVTSQSPCSNPQISAFRVNFG